MRGVRAMRGLRGAGARSVSRAQPSRPLAQPRCEERRAWRKLATRIGEHNVRNRARVLILSRPGVHYASQYDDRGIRPSTLSLDRSALGPTALLTVLQSRLDCTLRFWTTGSGFEAPLAASRRSASVTSCEQWFFDAGAALLGHATLVAVVGRACVRGLVKRVRVLLFAPSQ